MLNSPVITGSSMVKDCRSRRSLVKNCVLLGFYDHTRVTAIECSNLYQHLNLRWKVKGARSYFCSYKSNIEQKLTLVLNSTTTSSGNDSSIQCRRNPIPADQWPACGKQRVIWGYIGIHRDV